MKNLLLLAMVSSLLVAAGCDGDVDTDAYDVATCAFGSTETTCAPIVIPDSPRPWFALAFTLVDPNPGVPPGCAGTVDLEVNTAASGAGMLAWSAQELDAGTCAEVGPHAEGSAAVGEGESIDIAFPQAGFTFRVEVTPAIQTP